MQEQIVQSRANREKKSIEVRQPEGLQEVCEFR
jgi:hypothetical protein